MRVTPIIVGGLVLATPGAMIAPYAGGGPFPAPALALEGDDEPTWIDDAIAWITALCISLGLDCNFDESVQIVVAMSTFRDNYWSIAPATVSDPEATKADIEMTWTVFLDAPDTVDQDELRLFRNTLRSFYEDVGGDPATLPSPSSGQ